MTEKREWWSDDLIDAVFKALSYTYLAQGWAGGIAIDLDESVYPLIAAVEDWQRDRWTGVCESPEEVVRELKQAQAAIQRVRELCDESDRNRPSIDGYRINILPGIRRALDGDSDE